MRQVYIQCVPKVMVGLQVAVMLQPSSAEHKTGVKRKSNRQSFSFLCGACGSNQSHGLYVSVMMLPAERKVQCVLWLAKFESVTRVRREYRRVFNEEPPHENSIRRWDKQLKETGSLRHKKYSGRPPVSDESVEAIRTSFLRSRRKSVRKCARELDFRKQQLVGS
jgi:hypothetical protein